VTAYMLSALYACPSVRLSVRWVDQSKRLKLARQVSYIAEVVTKQRSE